jgi:hypothetical protein
MMDRDPQTAEPLFLINLQLQTFVAFLTANLDLNI